MATIVNHWKRHKHLGVAIPAGLIVAAWLSAKIWDSAPVWTGLMSAAAVVAGASIAKEAWMRLRMKQFSISLLITVASVGALWIGEAWEAAAVTFLYRLGGYLEDLTLGRTRSALRELIDLRPSVARVKGEDGEWHEVRAEEVRVGQLALVLPGDRVPVDGTVRAGRAAIDTSALTGEPLPQEVAVGDAVLSGSVSQGGYLEVEAEKVASETTFSRLLRLVAQAQNEKPQVQRFLDRFAQWYTPLVMAVALAILIWSQDVKLALTFLVIGCPGALVVAAPVAVVAGLGRAARSGILIKGGERLEQVGRLSAVAFDKTGTLTQGKPSVSSVTAFDGDEAGVLRLAVIAEMRSEHHLAKAILAYAMDQGIEPVGEAEWELHAGLGVEARTGDAHILVGNRKLLETHGVRLAAEHEAAVSERESQGETLAFVAVNGVAVGLIGIHDPIRTTAKVMIEGLKRAGIRWTVMLTGDHRDSAQRVANALGVDEVRAGLMPEEKVSAIKEIGARGHIVGMIGDGINDAPALAHADVSIAMGVSGTQAAMESADIVLVEDRLDKVPEAIQLSRRIMGIVRQNVAMAVVTVLLLLAGVVTRNVGLSLGMLVHEASVLIVIANGMRLLARPGVGRSVLVREGRVL